ncbi:restriction endonuclease subunit S [Metamycoplasma sualvi]|uniref:restriction endonuclease subunit S n=1 Tax=Metamycoplasma sualvi TaxID=2125 RepID=UPI003873116D
MAIKEYLLKDICYFQTGIDPLKDEINGEIPFVKLGNTNNNQIIYKYCDQITTNRKEKCNIGDLLLCWSCSIGESFIVEEECFFSTAFYKICKKNNVFLNKYLHYYFIKNKKYIYSLGVGSVLKKANMKILGNYSIKLPDLDEQQEIINIIEPKEDLFLKYNKVIDISNLDNFKKSWNNLINIIEPFEKLKVHLLNRKNLIIKLLNDLYLLNSSKNEKDILSFASLYNKKYQNQISYIETSNIDENFSLINNIKTIQKDKKPSRANLTPRENSLIFSKLIGSNKLFPIYDKKYLNYVYSTGFYNISSDDLDWYLFGFLNSDDFIKQKNNNSSGTLMEGITINGLKKIKIKLPKNNYHLNSILHLISKHNIIIKKIDNIISHLINLYIV